MLRTLTTLTAVPSVVLVAVLGAGCDGGQTSGNNQGGDVPVESAQSAPTPPSSRPGGGVGAGGPTESQENHMNINITIGDQTFGATLHHSPAARDLLAQLPVTVDMIDHGAVEKTGPLPGPLSLKGQPDGADPDVGDLGYYAPGNNLVLYYGDQSYFPGIVILGRLDDDAAERIADMTGSVTATIQAR
jgi:hypothetical protein